MTKKEWAALAVKLSSYYPNSFKMDNTQQVRDWFEALADLPSEHVYAGIMHMVRTQAAFPSIADIREHAAPPSMPWSLAWAEVMKAVGEVGRSGSPTWSSPAVAWAVAAIGWQEICDTPRSNLGTIRAQFRGAIEEANEAISRGETFRTLGIEPPRRMSAPRTFKELVGQEPLTALPPPPAPPNPQEESTP